MRGPILDGYTRGHAMRWARHLGALMVRWLSAHGLEAHTLTDIEEVQVRAAAGLEAEGGQVVTPIFLVCQRGMTPIIYPPTGFTQ